MKVPLCEPYIGEEEFKLVKKVLESGWLAHGPVGKKLEEKFRKYIGCKHAVGVNSCASALYAAIVANKLKGEIILPSFTFAASANAVVTAGCRPVFADVDYDTCNIDPEKIKKKLTDKTCAIMPVHYAGQSCDMGPIMEIAEKHGLAVIEDSAETLGGTYKGKMTGTFGTGCFSFYPTKNVTTGEGGMVTTDDDSVAETVKCVRGHGIVTSQFEREKNDKPWVKDVVAAGFNFRMSDVNAAIGIVQMGKLDKMNDLRRKHSAYLNEHLSGIGCIDIPVELKDCKHVYQMYTTKTKGISRDRLISMLRQRGIGAVVAFEPPVHLYTFYRDKGFDTTDLAVTEKLSKNILSLPMFPGMTAEQLDYTVKEIKSIVQTLVGK